MYYNKFTILIPTRERCETLYHTIRSCLNQAYQNFEVIVSDNFSVDRTYDVVMSFEDSRLKYINTGKRVSMSENFDFALSHVHDGYVMFIGDDDGVLPNSLEYVNSIINDTMCEAVVSHNAFYTWPDSNGKPNQLFWSSQTGYEIRDSKEWIQKYLTFRMSYTFDLPGAYCGFVKRDVFDRVTKEGRFFRSATPDAYSALAVSFAVGKYVYSHTAFAVHGASAKSNGSSYLSKAKGDEGEESKLFFKENTISFHPDIIMTKAFRISSLEAFLQFADAFPQLTKDITIDWKTFLRYVMTERIESTKEEIETAVKQMCIMHEIDYSEVASSIPNKYSRLTLSKIVEKIINKFVNFGKKTSIDDVTQYGVYNVHDAMLLLKYFLEEKKGSSTNCMGKKEKI